MNSKSSATSGYLLVMSVASWLVSACNWLICSESWVLHSSSILA
ncbi:MULTISPECIES: hypothetical protein [Okeania]|nr:MULTISPECIES: hypothetical protein [Okeania]